MVKIVAGDVADGELHAVGGVDVALHLRQRRGAGGGGVGGRARPRAHRRGPTAAATAAAGALQVELPVVAMHDRFRAGQALDVFAAAGVIEMVVAEDQVLDLHGIEIQLLDRGDDDVARVFLAVHRVEQDVAVVRRDQPRADAGVADPVEVVEQALPADDLGRTRRRDRAADAARCPARRPSRGPRSASRPTPCRRCRSRTADRDRSRRSPSPCPRTPWPSATSPPTAPSVGSFGAAAAAAAGRPRRRLRRTLLRARPARHATPLRDAHSRQFPRAIRLTIYVLPNCSAPLTVPPLHGSVLYGNAYAIRRGPEMTTYCLPLAPR